jgi:hypothetical protein
MSRVGDQAQDVARTERGLPPQANAARPAPSRILWRSFSVCSLMFLGYLLGAAVIFFDLPTSSLLHRAFAGGMAWYEGTTAALPSSDQLPPLTLGAADRPDKTCDGFTLCMYGGGTQAKLVNMRGDVVHQWHVPFSKLWTEPPHLRGRMDDARVYFNDAHLYPNGDLLVVIEGPINFGNASNGYGLAKLDRDSNVIWAYAEKCHHDVDVGDDGTIYALANETAGIDKIPNGLQYIPTPCLLDYIDIIAPEGKRLKRISLLDAIHNSPYAPLLCMLERPKVPGEVLPPGALPSPAQDDARRRDVLHANAVKVLTRSLAPKFPLFRAGQILVSLRHLDAIAVVDPVTEKVVWAARGPWRAQHDPSFLDNGHLLLFDNLGSPHSSRALEFDPQSQAFPWCYPGESGRPFFSAIRGMCQRLANGNTLIVNSDQGEIIEVTPDRETVWSLSCHRVELNRARRYVPAQLPFLEGVQRARP